jgi:hypothetical protein
MHKTEQAIEHKLAAGRMGKGGMLMRNNGPPETRTKGYS